jgi:dihydrofolate reductase
MRMLRVIEFLSLDGVMQAPGDPEEDTEGGFRHGGWQLPYVDDVLGESAVEGMASTDAYLFGRKTYEKMADFWPTAPADDPFAQHLNGTQKYVASRTLERVDWEPTTILAGDVAGDVAKLKEQPGQNIVVLGSGELVQTLIDHDLVDEFYLGVYPIVLGGGKKLFRDADDARKLDLIDSTPTTTGGVLLTYRPAG